jgi:subtilisin family serine protease
MTRRTGVAVTVVVLAFAGRPMVQAQGARDARSRLVPTEIQGRIHNPALVPPGLDPEALVTVVATLAGEPVALAQETAGRKLLRAEKDRIKAQRRGEQSAVRPSIEALGAEVVGTYQSALNGIKVRIPRRQLAALRQVPGVVSVKPVALMHPANSVAVPRIQAPAAWDGPAGVHGDGIKVAVIDSGIDYTHANFGGPGTIGAYAMAAASGALPADPSLVGPGAPKVKGGYDFVGDDYDPTSTDPAHAPRPDPNPLDGEMTGHGTVVASTLGGFGVTDTGQTYAGPYDATTHTRPFAIGPGVAPRADLYALRVFGRDGFKGTTMVVEAIDWAIDNDMDVINMSLGSIFSQDPGSDASSEAADNAVRAGIVVASVAGNNGDVPYITTSPGSSTRSISVGASLAPATMPGATVVAGGAARLLQNSNAAAFSGATYDVYVLKTATGGISLGCKSNTGSPDDWSLPANAANLSGKLVIVQRGVCARVAKAVYGEQHGAAAVLMINTDAALPPFEGPITQNPDDGSDFAVTIPFFGARSSDGPALRSLDGHAAPFAPAGIPTGLHPNTSSGPRYGDALLKPDITAPGVNIVSALVGSGTGSRASSGTSMATPMIAGTAALVLQTHPQWKPWQVKAAIVNSGRPSELANYRARSGGSGLVSTVAATRTAAIAFADRQTTTLNFGVQEFSADFHDSAPIFVRNYGTEDLEFSVSVTNQAGSPHTMLVSPAQVHVPAGGEAQVMARLVIPAATAGDTSAFRDAAGLVTFTPAAPSMNSGYALRVPYYAVPRVSSDVTATLESPHIDPASPGLVLLDNRAGAIAGTADFFAWGLESKKTPQLPGHIDLHAAGVQSLANGEIVVFAITTKEPWSTAGPQQFDVVIDANLDGVEDFGVISFDYGAVVNGVYDGRVGTFVIDFNTGSFSIFFLAHAPTDGSSILLPVPAAAIGVTPANPRFAYTVASWTFRFDDTDNTWESWAYFNPFTSAISTGAFEVVNPGDRIQVPFTINAAEWEATPALGLMVVTQDNRNGTAEANLLKVKAR